MGTVRPPRLSAVNEFLRTEAGGGVVLLVATVVALAWANSPWSGGYADLWSAKVAVGPAGWALHAELRHWVNDALMAVFFFVVGLEIKRELVAGELRHRRDVVLPVVAALGGMVVPALLFTVVVAGGAGARGWGVPIATDIAFAVGVLALLGSRVPPGLKVFLLALAIIDDIGAIAVIAVFYSAGVAATWLAGAGASLAGVGLLRRAGVARPLWYVPLGVAAWYCTYRAGVHPTIAAVALGLLTPTVAGGREVLAELTERLHPVSSFVVVPVFALANAGVDLGGGALRAAVTSRVAWGVALGLLVGKTVGIVGAVVAAERAGARLPAGVRRRHVAGVGVLGGIGFTVALFIAALAFDDPVLQAQAKVGILAGSLLSGVLGVAVLRGAARHPSA